MHHPQNHSQPQNEEFTTKMAALRAQFEQQIYRKQKRSSEFSKSSSKSSKSGSSSSSKAVGHEYKYLPSKI